MTAAERERLVDPALASAKGAPVYSVLEVARWFFGRTSHWIRWLDAHKGVLAPKKGSKKRAMGELRKYTLADVEDMVWSLWEGDAITRQVRDRALKMVALQTDIHRVFEPSYEYRGTEYPYDVSDVVNLSGKSANWVRARAADLGGVKRRWEDDQLHDSWRFPEFPEGAFDEEDES